MKRNKKKLVRQSEIVQSAIYSSVTVITQVLIFVVLSFGSQLQPFPICRIWADKNKIRYNLSRFSFMFVFSFNSQK